MRPASRGRNRCRPRIARAADETRPVPCRSLSTPIPAPTPARGARVALLAALAALLAATGCTKRGPPKLEEVIVGEWLEAGADGKHRQENDGVLSFHADGTWTEKHADWVDSFRPNGAVHGTYVLGPQCVCRLFHRIRDRVYNEDDPAGREGYAVAFEEFDAGILRWCDEDTHGAWVKDEGHSAKGARRTARVKRYDAVSQSNMAATIVGEWVSRPDQWFATFGKDLKWSTTNWGGAPWFGRWGVFVMASDHEVLLQRDRSIFGEYLKIADGHLVHVGENKVTNVFDRVPTSTQAAHE